MKGPKKKDKACLVKKGKMEALINVFDHERGDVPATDRSSGLGLGRRGGYRGGKKSGKSEGGLLCNQGGGSKITSRQVEDGTGAGREEAKERGGGILGHFDKRKKGGGEDEGNGEV